MTPRRTAQPVWIEPMLAVLTRDRFSDSKWIFEPKLDGVRCLAYVRRGRGRGGARVRLLSRNRKPLDGAYPEVAEALATAEHDMVLDGEIVALSGGVSSFERLQQRLGKHDPVAARASGIRIHYYVFDILHLDGQDLRRAPFAERKRALKASLSEAGPVRLTPHRRTAGEAYYEAACRRGMEGVIAKRLDAPYRAGRSDDWLKFKCVNEQEFVIGGWTDPEGSRTGFGALLAGYYEDGVLRYAGKVGTGYDAATLDRLAARLRKLERKTSPFDDFARDRLFIHWAKPVLVAQLGFQEWTAKGLLRQPRFLGLRDDKAASAVIRERPRPR
ncbi:MAG: non-homologous end-joining DNA ligase [Gemmatimonadota bacterium]